MEQLMQRFGIKWQDELSMTARLCLTQQYNYTAVDYYG